ncbi:MAG TPA: hypothetical protein QKA08_00540 [Candidatus Megaira endosymbiont of Nemacystus decipiens]|nr:hypothetical protein [Candidatus Megaera endosymbiont of Nemacystus decipiens]
MAFSETAIFIIAGATLLNSSVAAIASCCACGWSYKTHKKSTSDTTDAYYEMEEKQTEGKEGTILTHKKVKKKVNVADITKEIQKQGDFETKENKTAHKIATRNMIPGNPLAFVANAFGFGGDGDDGGTGSGGGETYEYEGEEFYDTNEGILSTEDNNTFIPALNSAGGNNNQSQQYNAPQIINNEIDYSQVLSDDTPIIIEDYNSYAPNQQQIYYQE